MTREEAVEIIRQAFRQIAEANMVAEIENPFAHHNAPRECYIVVDVEDITICTINDPLCLCHRHGKVVSS